MVRGLRLLGAGVLHTEGTSPATEDSGPQYQTVGQTQGTCPGDASVHNPGKARKMLSK